MTIIQDQLKPITNNAKNNDYEQMKKILSYVFFSLENDLYEGGMDEATIKTLRDKLTHHAKDFNLNILK